MDYVTVEAAIVIIPADRAGRFAEHEAFVEPAWIETAARDDADTAPVQAPSLAQLWHALARGLLAPLRTAERVGGFVTPDDAGALCAATGVGCFEVLVTPAGPLTASPYHFPAVIRRAVAVGAGARPPRRRRIARPCAPRDGRGAGWPPARTVRAGVMTRQARTLERGALIASVYDDGDWALVATDIAERPIGWVPSLYLEDADAA